MVNKISFFLVVLSGLLHPLWNMILKKSDDKMTFYLNVHIIFTILCSFILFIYPIRTVTAMGWFFVILSALTHFFYQIFLCRTYEIGDLSLTYPIIRSSPIFVAIMGFIFLGEVPSNEALLGIIMVIIGVNIINQRRMSIRGFITPFRHIKRDTVLMASLTAFSSACYLVVDKKGAMAMEPVLFFYLFFAISGFLFLGYLLSIKKIRKSYVKDFYRDKKRIVLVAILEFTSYILILYAFRISKVAYIIALRQISVVFSALYGIWFLKEKYGEVRFVGSLVIFAGIFLVVAFG